MLLEGSCHCGACPDESLAEWRRRLGLESPD